MTPEKYEKLRGKIIEACPELMELSFGCRFLRVDEELIFVCKKDGMWLYIDPEDMRSWEWMNPKKERTTILGHPIRISHVLRALAVETIPAVSIDQDGWLQFYPEEHGVYYNLDQDDLALQSDETKEFLFNLLTPKTDEA